MALGLSTLKSTCGLELHPVQGMSEGPSVSSLAQVVVGRILIPAGCWPEASFTFLLSGLTTGALTLLLLSSS